LKRHRSHLLGLAFDGQSIDIAEIRVEAGTPRVVRQTSMLITLPLSLDQPTPLGAALAAHLKREGIQARHAIAGISARAVSARSRTAPAAATAQAKADIVRLSIEREAGAAASELVADFVEGPVHDQQQHLLLITSRRRHVVAITQCLHAAGITLDALTVTPLELGSRASDAGTLLYVTPDGVEATSHHGGRPISLTRIAVDLANVDDHALAGAVSRAFSVSPSRTLNGHARLPGVWVKASPLCPAGAADRVQNTLGERRIVMPTNDVSPAAALALSAVGDRMPMVDLIHSRLAEAPVAGVSPLKRWSIIGAILLISCIAIAAYAMHERGRSLDELQAEHARLAPAAQRLQAIRVQTRAVGPWFDDRPNYLLCLAALTECFPTAGSIRATSIRLDEQFAGVVQCRAESRGRMLELLQRMQSDARFDHVRLRDSSQADRAGGDVGFEITFSFNADNGGAP